MVAACKFNPGEAERLLLELDSDTGHWIRTNEGSHKWGYHGVGFTDSGQIEKPDTGLNEV